MLNMTNELKAKLLVAKSAEEVTELVKADGQEITAEDAVHLWEEITKHREQDGKELSLDELEAVSGGSRNWAEYGCQATVEDGSWCWSNDACWYDDVVYEDFDASQKCPCYPGRHHYDQTETEFGTEIHMRAKMVCRYCGNSYMTEWDRVIFK